MSDGHVYGWNGGIVTQEAFNYLERRRLTGIEQAGLKFLSECRNAAICLRLNEVKDPYVAELQDAVDEFDQSMKLASDVAPASYVYDWDGDGYTTDPSVAGSWPVHRRHARIILNGRTFSDLVMICYSGSSGMIKSPIQGGDGEGGVKYKTIGGCVEVEFDLEPEPTGG